MKDEKYIKTFKAHSVWNRDEIHRELVECAKYIEGIGADMQRSLRYREKNRHELWVFMLSELRGLLSHVERHADCMQTLLNKHCANFVSKSVEKRIKEIKAKQRK